MWLVILIRCSLWLVVVMMLRLLASVVVSFRDELLLCTASSVVDNEPRIRERLHDLVREFGISPTR